MKIKKLNLSGMMAGTLAAATVFTAMPTNAFANSVEYVYGYLNVPYDVFYAEYMDLDNVVDEGSLNVALNVDSNGDNKLDAVTTATTKKFTATTGLAAGSYNDGTRNIKGVTLPVRVRTEDAATLSSDNSSKNLTANSDYYFAPVEETLSYYADVTVNEAAQTTAGYYEIGKMKESEYTNEYLNIANLTYTGRYGDYQISLGGVNPSKGLRVGEDEYVPNTLYGAIINTEDGGHYGMTVLENIWLAGRNTNVEMAFSVPEGRQLTNHGSELFTQMTGLTGDTISSITLITSNGVITINDSKVLNPYVSAQDLKLSFDGTNLNVVDYPIANAQTTVTINGMLDEETVNFDASNATIALPTAPKEKNNYTVVFQSEGYAPIYASVSTEADESLYGQLGYWYGKLAKAIGKAGAEYPTYSTMVAQKKAAAELLKDSKSGSYATAEMIAKIKKLVAGLVDTTGEIASASLSDNKLNVDVKDFAKLQNPTYQLTVRSGRSTITLASGELTSKTVTLKEKPVVGTTYTLTVSSDNYTDATAEVTATATPQVRLDSMNATYTGKAVSVKPAVVDTGVEGDTTAFEITYVYYTDAACKVKTSKAKNQAAAEGAAPVNAGTYYVKAFVAANGNYNAATSQAAKLVIAKKNATVSVSTNAKTIAVKQLSKKAQTFKIAASVTGNGTISFAKTSGNAKITVDAKTGKVTVKKGLKKGTYAIKVKVSAKASTNYNAATKTVTIKIVVK
ncbi:MAG: hypothetical protein K6G13_02825 [Agathobacter sp.]|uniref:hypothetical protein n=1 Tax=Agathobacter sp. TaxID=2021311 RepID=UPI00258D4704|nr:hypothetical protein [Agathobacter sp.]MCR5676949.1 hypothetical protein [Agathobacter sp.]